MLVLSCIYEYLGPHQACNGMIPWCSTWKKERLIVLILLQFSYINLCYLLVLSSIYEYLGPHQACNGIISWWSTWKENKLIVLITVFCYQSLLSTCTKLYLWVPGTPPGLQWHDTMVQYMKEGEVTVLLGQHEEHRVQHVHYLVQARRQ